MEHVVCGFEIPNDETRISTFSGERINEINNVNEGFIFKVK